MRSSSSAKATAAAKQAALEAKANVLQKLHELQQKKSQVELQGEIAAAKAGKLVFEQCKAGEIHLNQVYQEQVKPPSVYSRHSSKASVDNVIPVDYKAPLKLDEVNSEATA